uniref:Uncharacterized protein n=1 Tax=Setaria viridis TaxID=4556 RepID=A0A4U6VPY7_SETVI|nr:hypothetical protein SEVIR_2G134450v2 [Setaria viridis]
MTVIHLCVQYLLVFSFCFDSVSSRQSVSLVSTDLIFRFLGSFGWTVLLIYSFCNPNHD